MLAALALSACGLERSDTGATTSTTFTDASSADESPNHDDGQDDDGDASEDTKGTESDQETADASDDESSTSNSGGDGDSGRGDETGASGCESDPGWNALTVGSPVKHIQALDQHGAAFDLSDSCGRPVMLDVVTGWCSPCKEMASFFAGQTNDSGILGQNGSNLRNMIADGRVVWVTMMTQGLTTTPATVADAAAWDESYPNPNISVLAEGDVLELSEQWGIGTYPNLVLVDEELIHLMSATGNAYDITDYIWERWGG